MVWRRLPSYFPNLALKLVPLTEAQQAAFDKTGFLRVLTFRTAPSVNKASRGGPRRAGSLGGRGGRRRAGAGGSPRLQWLTVPAHQLSAVRSAGCACPPTGYCLGLQAEIKAFLEGVYGLKVDKVNTLNYEGTKIRGKHGSYRSGQEGPAAAAAA